MGPHRFYLHVLFELKHLPAFPVLKVPHAEQVSATSPSPGPHLCPELKPCSLLSTAGWWENSQCRCLGPTLVGVLLFPTCRTIKGERVPGNKHVLDAASA